MRAGAEGNAARGAAARGTLRAWLEEGEFCLCMSSSFFGLWAHLGTAAALWDSGFEPSHVCGSSAGGVIAAALGSGIRPYELLEMLDELKTGDVLRFCRPPSLGLLDILGAMEAFMRARLKKHRLEDCDAPTVSISTYDPFGSGARVLSSGDLLEAAAASACVPLLFGPVDIEGRPHWDGGIADHGGLKGAPEGLRVLYHHASSLPLSSGAVRPDRRRCAVLRARGLPFVHPLNFERVGWAAFNTAYQATLRAMDDAPSEGTAVWGYQGVPGDEGYRAGLPRALLLAVVFAAAVALFVGMDVPAALGA